MRLHEPHEAVAVAAADLLVRDDDEDEVARRLESFARERRERDRRRRGLVLHVERAPPPHLAVDEVAGPRVAIPLGRDRRAPCRCGERNTSDGPVAALEPRDEVGAVRLARVQLAVDPAPREVVLEDRRRADLVPRRVDGVDAEELLQERGDLVAERHRRGLRLQPAPLLESAVSSLRTSQSSGKDVFVTRRPSSSTGVPCVPTTLSPITRATTW